MKFIAVVFLPAIELALFVVCMMSKTSAAFLCWKVDFEVIVEFIGHCLRKAGGIMGPGAVFPSNGTSHKLPPFG